MEVIVAKTAGFCFGVKRAVDKVYEQIRHAGKPIYTYGPIIHNEEVVKDLEEKGVRVIESEEELKELHEGIVIIRSHGVGKHVYDILEANGIACLRFDFYGCGESDGEFEEMTFTGLLEETQDVYEWLKGQDFVDTDKIILSGQRMGGFVAATAAPKLNPYGLILMCPGAGMWNGCKEKADFFKNQGMTFADMEGLKFGLDFNYDLATYSPFEDAKGYDGKVLILRGTEDNLVDDKTCETYLEGYNGNGTFVKIPKGNHNFASIPAREACESEILNFVKSII